MLLWRPVVAGDGQRGWGTPVGSALLSLLLHMSTDGPHEVERTCEHEARLCRGAGDRGLQLLSSGHSI